MVKILESKIESYLKDQVDINGGLAYKFISSVNGVPDQIVIYNGDIHFVEVKRPNEKPRPLQTHVHDKIKDQGVDVHVVDSYKSVDWFLVKVLGVKPKTRARGRKPTTIMKWDMFDI